jgi:hypothetical protein
MNMDITNSKIINNSLNVIRELENKNIDDNIKYYEDILNFLNLLFDTDNKSILKIRIKNLNLTKNIILIYNSLINKHKLNCQIFDIDNFDFNNNYERDFIIKIVKIMVCNLLKKINYRIIERKNKLIIESLI